MVEKYLLAAMNLCRDNQSCYNYIYQALQAYRIEHQGDR